MDEKSIDALPLLNGGPKFPNRRICMLMVTHECNLNCVYCYEAFKGSRKMSFEMAISVLKKELALVRQSGGKFKEHEVEFMGGEPMMNFDLIKKVVLWMKANAGDIPWISFCSTNGTLVTDEIKPWLTANRSSFVMGLSYDGDCEMQTSNRGTQRLAIDVEFFIKTWPRQNMHMTVSRETLPRLARGIVSVQELGGGVDVALAQGVGWVDSDAALFLEQLRSLGKIYLARSDLKPVNLMSRSLGSIDGGDRPQKKFCGTGTHMIAYDVDGQPYPCHMFTPIVMGPDTAILLKNVHLSDGCVLDDPYCDGCLYKNWCPTCCGFNFRIRGDLAKRDHAWCLMIEAQVVALIEFQVAFYRKNMSSLTSADAAQLRGLLKAYETIKTRR